MSPPPNEDSAASSPGAFDRETGHSVFVNLVNAGGAERTRLEVEVLLLRGHPGVADFHV